VKAACLANLASPQSGATPQSVEACAMALPGESCTDYLENNPVAACVPKAGYGVSGVTCSFDSQCKSGYCALPVGAACGTCQNRPAAGDSCAMTGCGLDLVYAGMQTCHSWLGFLHWLKQGRHQGQNP
jgi:hypothetical protein